MWDVPFGEVLPLGDPPFDPQLAEHFFHVVRDGGGHHAPRPQARGRNTHHVIEATFKGVARCLRDAVRVEGGARAVDEGRAVT